MSDEGTLNWSLPPALAELGCLPIRLFREDGRVAASGLSGHPITVAAGNYYLACTLPNGREIVRRKPVELKAGEAVDPVFPFLEFDLSPAEGEATVASDEAPAPGRLMSFIRALTARFRGGGDATAEARLHKVDWMHLPDVWHGPDPAQSAPVIHTGVGERPVTLVQPTEAGIDQLIEAAGADGGRVFFVVPFDRAIGSGDVATIEVELRRADGLVRPRFRSAVNGEVGAFLDFVENGLLEPAAALSNAFLARSDEALRGASALQAVLSAYVMLRANTIFGDAGERMLRLDRLAAGVPDVPIIEVELLARLGRHDEAVAALRRAVRGGCPWFRSGVAYALERLRFYVEVDAAESSPFRLSDEDRRLFVERRSYYGALGRRLETWSLLATFVYPPVARKSEAVAAPAAPAPQPA